MTRRTIEEMIRELLPESDEGSGSEDFDLLTWEQWLIGKPLRPLGYNISPPNHGNSLEFYLVPRGRVIDPNNIGNENWYPYFYYWETEVVIDVKGPVANADPYCTLSTFYGGRLYNQLEPYFNGRWYEAYHSDGSSLEFKLTGDKLAVWGVPKPGKYVTSFWTRGNGWRDTLTDMGFNSHHNYNGNAWNNWLNPPY